MYKDWQEDKQFILHGVLPFLGVVFASYMFFDFICRRIWRIKEVYNYDRTRKRNDY